MMIAQGPTACVQTSSPPSVQNRFDNVTVSGLQFLTRWMLGLSRCSCSQVQIITKNRQSALTVAKPYINPPVAMITNDTKNMVCTQQTPSTVRCRLLFTRSPFRGHLSTNADIPCAHWHHIHSQPYVQSSMGHNTSSLQILYQTSRSDERSQIDWEQCASGTYFGRISISKVPVQREEEDTAERVDGSSHTIYSARAAGRLHVLVQGRHGDLRAQVRNQYAAVHGQTLDL